MQELAIVNENREVLAQIFWSPPHKIQVTSANAELKAWLEAIVQRYAMSGITGQTGNQEVVDGKTVYSTSIILIPQDDPRFLMGIREHLGRLRFQGKRVFGIVRRARG